MVNVADDERRILGEFADYSGMLETLRSRVEELQIQGERFEHFAGLPTGYLSKLIGVRPVRRMSSLEKPFAYSGSVIRFEIAIAQSFR